MANVGSQQNVKLKYFRSKYQLKHDANLSGVKIHFQGSLKDFLKAPYYKPSLLGLVNSIREEVEKHLSQGYKFILVYVQETCK